MKKIAILIIFLCLEQIAIGQTSYEGWYYVPTPAANIWGIGYNKPINGNDLSYVGDDINVDESKDIVRMAGPKSSIRVFKTVKDLALTSLFKGNKAITYTVATVNLNQVRLASNRFKDFNNNNYYVTQALVADSVVIKGQINKSMGVDTKDAEKMIDAYAGHASVAFQLVNTITGKDTSTKTGIISAKRTNNDSFIIVITDPNIYFAVRLTKVQSIDRTDKKVEIGLSGDVIKVLPDGDTTKVLSWTYSEIKRDFNVSIRFETKDSNATLEMYQSIGKKDSLLDKVTKVIRNKQIHFVAEATTISPNVSTGRHTAKDYLITLHSEFVFDPSNNTITADDDNGGPFLNYIDHVKGEYTVWPKR